MLQHSLQYRNVMNTYIKKYLFYFIDDLVRNIFRQVMQVIEWQISDFRQLLRFLVIRKLGRQNQFKLFQNQNFIKQEKYKKNTPRYLQLASYLQSQSIKILYVLLMKLFFLHKTKAILWINNKKYTGKFSRQLILQYITLFAFNFKGKSEKNMTFEKICKNSQVNYQLYYIFFTLWVVKSLSSIYTQMCIILLVTLASNNWNYCNQYYIIFQFTVEHGKFFDIYNEKGIYSIHIAYFIAS
eukprot:TRINITY_DN1644_c0_g1_i8.p2 TRINITY_DN1644_c0_g1~~TRINITY_DN1644_c0_g1_i8.p2  ORF type:complete len:240 (-),score=-29.75 TRINITY_DN1644_c0_g1_i8:338-1057(-)